MRRKAVVVCRSFLIRSCLVLFPLVLICLVGELVLGIFRHSPIIVDDKMGWKPGPNYLFSGEQVSADGSSYSTHISQNESGFRQFGSLKTDKPKLLVIGDSFTQALAASDDRTYYAIIGQQLDMEVFAYGAGGASTLQEYIAFDQFFDEISPDLVLWQYCSNDFINNSYDLEFNSRINNNGMTRPYLEEGTIVYRMPKPYPELFSFFIARSRVLRFVLTQIYKIQAKNPDTVEREIATLGTAHPGFQKAYEITRMIMEKVKQRAGQAPVVAFNCDNSQPYHDAFRDISEELDIYYIEGIGDVISEAKQSGRTVLADDNAHWNETGHALVGETISRYLNDKILDCCL